MQTVKEYFREFRKDIDINAFTELAGIFFQTDEFWELNINDNAMVFINAIANGKLIAEKLKQNNLSQDFKAVDAMTNAVIKNMREQYKHSILPFADNKSTELIQELLGLYVRKLLNLNFIAYMAMYIKIEFEDGITSYVAYESDFRRPVTEEIVMQLRNGIQTLSGETAGKNAVKATIITKEEYDANHEAGAL